jgi:hypothetical protein
VAYALVPTLLAALLFVAAGYVSMLRGARIRLFPDDAIARIWAHTATG